MANEIRVRSDFVAGGLSAGMLTSDTLMSSAGLADLPAIGATQQAALTLWRADVLGRITQKETIYVTAHTAAAVTATVTRGREGTTAQTWLTGDRWSMSSIASDLITVCTSSTRPATPYYGQMIYETDTKTTRVYSANGWVQPNEYSNVGLSSKGTLAALWLEERDLAGTSWAVYATGTEWRVNGAGTDMLAMNRTAPAAFRILYGNLDLGMNEIRLHSRTNSDHKLKYMATAPGGAGDGPVLFGYNKGHLATTVGGELWQAAWQSDGSFTSRGALNAGASSSVNGVLAMGQGKGYGANRFHFSGDGNDMHQNWGAGWQMWVDVTNVKTFVIQHPTFKTKYLVHACLEGPEATVIYRGQSALKDGWTRVDLPAYFEALCAVEGRSVQLTCIASDPMDEWCPVLHATYPKNGSFYVGLGSGMVIGDQRFWWQVIAVRKDVPPLLVEPLQKDVVVMGSGPYSYYKEK